MNKRAEQIFKIKSNFLGIRILLEINHYSALLNILENNIVLMEKSTIPTLNSVEIIKDVREFAQKFASIFYQDGNLGKHLDNFSTELLHFLGVFEPYKNKGFNKNLGSYEHIRLPGGKEYDFKETFTGELMTMDEYLEHILGLLKDIESSISSQPAIKRIVSLRGTLKKLFQGREDPILFPLVKIIGELITLLFNSDIDDNYREDNDTPIIILGRIEGLLTKLVDDLDVRLGGT